MYELHMYTLQLHMLYFSRLPEIYKDKHTQKYSELSNGCEFN